MKCVIYFHIFQEASLCALMKFVEAEGKHPLQNKDLIEHYSFPWKLLRVGFLYNYRYWHAAHWIYTCVYITLIPLMCTDPGGASSLNERRHVTAHHQVSRVFGDGRCALLRHEFSTRQHVQSHDPKQKGECSCVYIASFSAYLFCIINYTNLFLYFLGSDSCISK